MKNDGYVYIISNPESYKKKSWIKIGNAKDVSERLKTLNTAVPFDFKLLIKVRCDNYIALERVLHKKFQKNQVGKEIYNVPAGVVLEEIKDFTQVCGDMVISVYDEYGDIKNEYRNVNGKLKDTKVKKQLDNAFSDAKTATAKVLVIKATCLHSEARCYQAKDGQFILMKDSGVRSGIVESFVGDKDDRANKIAQYCKRTKKGGLILKEDISFPSLSAAACFVKGNQVNGKNVWKEVKTTEEGLSLFGSFLTLNHSKTSNK